MTAFRPLPREVYARAERLLEKNIAKLVFNAALEPHWLPGGSLWYRREGREGASFIHVDAASGLKTVLSEPEACARAPKPPPPDASRAPGGRWELLRIGHDIALREVAGGNTRRLTANGTADSPYAASPDTNLQAVTQRVQGVATPPVAAWSADGTRLVTHRLDQGAVGLLPLIQSCPADGSTRPVVHQIHMPLPGDAAIGHAELLVVEAATGKILPVETDPLPIPFLSPLELGWVWWSDDSARIYFLREGRGSKSLELCAADAATGTVRPIFAETSESYVEPSPLLPWLSQVRTLGATGEVVWPSERDGWRHLYLLDEASGQIKRQLTAGPWVVRELIDIDPAGRLVYFTASGREAQHDPYLRQLYRVSLDGGAPEQLTEAEADHKIHLAPDRTCFVATASRVDLAPVSELRAADGRLIAELERADLTDFFGQGFTLPERFTVKAADGATDLHGVLYKPSDFDPARRYPVVDDLYPGPQLIRTPKSFCLAPSAAFETWPGQWISQSLAELGFVVINLDGRGTPLRTRDFHLASYGRLEEAGCLEDHLAALDQLAAERPYLDLGRLGVVGHSAGGYAATRALLAYPQRYKVAVASSPDQDLLCYLGYWAEKYQGLPIDGRYRNQANAALAEALQGRLLMIHGELDDNVNPYATPRFVDALIRADKDFDLLIVPGANHDLLNHPYVVRRKWDYLVTHLMGALPPR